MHFTHQKTLASRQSELEIDLDKNEEKEPTS